MPGCYRNGTLTTSRECELTSWLSPDEVEIPKYAASQDAGPHTPTQTYISLLGNTETTPLSSD